MEAVTSFLKKHNIQQVHSTLPDLTGNARGKFYPCQKFIDEKGGRIPEDLLLKTVTGDWANNHYDLMDAADIDMILKPDANTLRMVPWAKVPTAQVINDCYGKDGKLHPLSSRNVLRRVLALYEQEGLKPVIAPECEFYLLEQNHNPNDALTPATGRNGRKETARQSYSLDSITEFGPVIDSLYDYCKAQNLDVDILIHESGAAQFEVNFLHGDPMDLADQVYVFKRTLKEVALEHGVYATFMAKPIQEEPGSSMHIHQSILDMQTGQNILAADNEKFSERFYHYVAGLQKFTPSAMAFFAPTVNSYRRFAPGIAAPVNMKWGIDNRTAGIRAPDSVPAATRIENRFPGADCNPYLAIAASLACGLLGLKAQLQPDEPVAGAASADDDPVEVARSLEEALRLLEQSTELKEIMGDKFVEAFIGVKRTESEAFHQVISAWEREFLLLAV